MKLSLFTSQYLYLAKGESILTVEEISLFNLVFCINCLSCSFLSILFEFPKENSRKKPTDPLILQKTFFIDSLEHPYVFGSWQEIFLFSGSQNWPLDFLLLLSPFSFFSPVFSPACFSLLLGSHDKEGPQRALKDLHVNSLENLLVRKLCFKKTFFFFIVKMMGIPEFDVT
jgi:hypothetical protein